MTTNNIDTNNDGRVSEKEYQDHWMNRRWRPAMAWMYMVVCIFDFIIFPAMWVLVLAVKAPDKITQWTPITMAGAGFFHLTMGAIIGIAAWNRTKEKLADKSQVGH